MCCGATTATAVTQVTRVTQWTAIAISLALHIKIHTSHENRFISILLFYLCAPAFCAAAFVELEIRSEK